MTPPKSITKWTFRYFFGSGEWGFSVDKEAHIQYIGNGSSRNGAKNARSPEVPAKGLSNKIASALRAEQSNLGFWTLARGSPFRFFPWLSVFFRSYPRIALLKDYHYWPPLGEQTGWRKKYGQEE